MLYGRRISDRAQHAVVRVELEEVQVVEAEVAAQAGIGPQPTVEVLHRRTGTDPPRGWRIDRLAGRVVPTAELVPYRGFLGLAWIPMEGKPANKLASRITMRYFVSTLVLNFTPRSARVPA
jgi:hypothetical protein